MPVEEPECPEGAEKYQHESRNPDKFGHSGAVLMSSGEAVRRGDRETWDGSGIDHTERDHQS